MGFVIVTCSAYVHTCVIFSGITYDDDDMMNHEPCKINKSLTPFCDVSYAMFSSCDLSCAMFCWAFYVFITLV